MNFRNCIMTCLAGAALAAVAATAQSPADGAPTGAPASTPPKAPVRIPTAPDVLVVEKVDVAAGEVHGVIERTVVKEVTETRVRKVQRPTRYTDGSVRLLEVEETYVVTQQVPTATKTKARWKAGPLAWISLKGKKQKAKEALAKLKNGDVVVTQAENAELAPAWNAALRPDLLVLVGAVETTTSAYPPTAGAATETAAPAGKPEAAAARSEPAADLSAEERDVLDRVNSMRQQLGLPLFAIDPTLMTAARGHSANMARQRQMNHVLDGAGPWQRTAALGFDTGAVAENCAQGQTTAAEVVDSWNQSPGHRANMLSGSYVRIGIGVANDGYGQRYWTQVFAGPRG
ncbi:MAG TPA: CAP domain-containing protein [Planctomycetia bacterium]|nr:CAP domain-containing protein [Planctomycetia bacterium]